MSVSEWQLDGHQVRLRYGWWLGGAQIAVDGNVIFKRGPVWSEPGFVHRFKIGEMACAVRVTSQGLSYRYEFLSGGDAERAGDPAPRRSPLWQRLRAYLEVTTPKLLLRISAWCAARHPVVLAVLLLLPIWLFEHFQLFRFYGHGDAGFVYLRWSAIFGVGAIQRGKWRQVLSLVLLACAGCAVDRAIPSANVLGIWDYTQPVIRAAVFIVLAALGESYATTHSRPRSLRWLLALAIAAGTVHAGVHDFAFYCRWAIKIPNMVPRGQDWIGHFYTLGAVYWPLLAALTWFVIPLSAEYIEPVRRRVISTLCGVSLCVLGYASYAAFAVPRIAAYSVEHDSPFRRVAAVWLLELRAYSGLSDLLWRQLENDDWQPIDDEAFYSRWNWRQVSIHVLAKRDREGTARQLCELLLRRPRHHLAEEASDLLVDCRRYESAPILLRYALADSVEEIGNGWTKKLVQMGVPQAAEMIFRDAARSEHFRNRPDILELLSRRTNWNSTDDDETLVSPEQRRDLKRLLYDDAGDKLLDWVLLYAEIIDSVETSLTREQHIEVQRTSECFRIYLRGLKLWRRIEHIRLRQYALDRLRAESPEDAAQVEILNRDILLHRSLELFDENSRLARALSKFDRYFEEGYWKVDVPSPNWDVPTVDELEREMTQYLRSGVAATKAKDGDDASDDNESLDGGEQMR